MDKLKTDRDVCYDPQINYAEAPPTAGPQTSKVLELKRKVVFKSGNHLNLRNITSWDAKGTYVRIQCDEGYVLLREKSIDYHIITPAEGGITG